VRCLSGSLSGYFCARACPPILVNKLKIDKWDLVCEVAVKCN
jgi:hypothetical protein